MKSANDIKATGKQNLSDVSTGIMELNALETFDLIKPGILMFPWSPWRSRLKVLYLAKSFRKKYVV